MNQSPDSYEDSGPDGGAVAWTLLAAAFWTLVLLVGVFLTQPGCTYNRNAPLLNFEPTIEANGNTVPVSAVP